MKNYRFLLTILAVLLLCASVAFVSCTGTGDETTSGSDQPTESPEATDEPTAEVTTESAPDSTEEVTTEAPEVTTNPPHTHTFGEWNTLKATSCKEEGLVERACSCGYKETQTIAKTEHRAGEWIIDKEANATEEGSKHLPCAVCGETIKTETIPVTPHVPGEWIIDKEATCTEAGSKHRVCTKCGETSDTETIPAKGHREVIDPAKAATCTESGLTEGKHCSVCNAVITEQKTVAANGHNEVADPAKNATCTESGLTAGSHCSVCKAVIMAQNAVPAKGHVEETHPSCGPTCTASGLTEGKSCKVCGAITVAQQTIPATGHKDGEWITDKEATLTSTGSKHLVCSVCGETVRTETIPVLEPEKADYSVTVTDGLGAPLADMTVSFVSGDKKAGEGKTDKSGKITVSLPEGEYAVSVDAGAEYYAPDSVKLTAANPTAEIVLVGYASNPEYVYPGEDTGVYRVSVGSVRVPVEKGTRRFFFFAPSEGAIYKVYTDSDKVNVGYYGGSFYVYDNNTGEFDENGALILEVLKSSVGNTLVLGLDSTSSAVTECTLTIVRYSDIGTSLEEIPYEMYEYQTPVKTETPKGNLHYVSITVTLPAGGAVSEIPVVYNEKDGYYHLNTADGPILYVRLKDKTVFQEALLTIVGTSNLGRYVYDENGNFVGKERYNEAIMAYSDAADSKYGVYPLNDDLMYILKALEDNGWYDRTSPNCIFTDDSVIVMPFNGWLFACVYFS